MKHDQDVRDIIFAGIRDKRNIARISSQGEGILSGVLWLKKACEKLGLNLKECRRNGARLGTGETVAVVEGTAKQIALGEEELIGWISKASGIATAARKAKTAAGRNLKVVCGAWKKMPLPIKDLVRQAVADGGIPYRIADIPFLYLDKNYVRALGGVGKTMQSVNNLEAGNLVIQLKGERRELLREAVLAARGADVIMIDTGRREDIIAVDSILRVKGLRSRVQIAFAGNVDIDDLVHLKKLPVDVVDIGQAVIDAPLLDMRMDIAEVWGEKRGA